PNFNSRYATLDELIKKAYKCRVNQENRNHDYTKFATDRKECATVILQNLCKAWMLAGGSCDLNHPWVLRCVEIMFFQALALQPSCYPLYF
ncbi:MAG: hypothetical protein RR226_05790, partial [Oscillospiraceae bacterium]